MGLLISAPASADVFTLGPPDLSIGGSGAVCRCESRVFFQLTAEPGVAVAAPYDGTLTGWRVRQQVNGTTGELRLRVLRPAAGGAYTSVERSAPASSVDGTLNPANLAIRQGDRIGVEVRDTTNDAIYSYGVNAKPNVGTVAAFTAGYANGETAIPTRYPTADTMLTLNLNAEVQYTPAAQPQPQPAQPPPPTAAPSDGTAPRISLMTLTPTRFAAANIGPSLIAATVGTQVIYEVSEPATTKFAVARPLKGRKAKGKKCGKPTRKNRKGRRCTYFKPVKGSVAHTAKAGLNRFRFTGRIGGKALKRGKYRLSAIATDSARNRSAPRTRSFTIVK